MACLAPLETTTSPGAYWVSPFSEASLAAMAARSDAVPVLGV